MDNQRQSSAYASRFYVDFEPKCLWTEDGENNMLRVDIPGFKKEYLRVQIDGTRNLKISGEHPLLPLHENKWSRFRKMFQIPYNSNNSKIKAKFENGALFVIIPKKPEEKQDVVDQDSKKPENNVVDEPKPKASMTNSEEEKEEEEEEEEEEEKEVESTYVRISRRISQSFRYGSEIVLGVKSEEIQRKKILVFAIMLAIGVGFYATQRWWSRDANELAIISHE